ncbi:MAG: hypothetical protein JHD16_11160 [Solirubrobacteraceae bacterium]|nr:hypothetical protein [Solirubrobacteraceae bacterium]
MPRGTVSPSRLEAGALATALIAATLIGAALPGSRDAQARPTPAPIYVATAPPADQIAVLGTRAQGGATSDSATEEPAATTTETTATDPVAEPAATTADTSAEDTEEDAAGDSGDGSDPLASGSDRLDQVALVIVHGDAPARWITAPAGSAAKARADRGTTFTGLAATPAAPLATGLELIAGQPPNSATRSTCVTGDNGPVTPGTLDEGGRVVGTGCVYPAGTSSLPTAVAVDGRRWRAYAPVEAADAASALCGTGTPTGAAAAFASTSALRRLEDLATSGACESAAAPLSALAGDLAADEPPAWILIEVGACGAGPCSPDAEAARERDLDAAIDVLLAEDGLGDRSAVLVVGDGNVAGLEPAATEGVVASPDDPNAPPPVVSGALLLGPGAATAATDPLAIDAFAIARTQADWLGLDAPGQAKADGVTGLAVPAG